MASAESDLSTRNNEKRAIPPRKPPADPTGGETSRHVGRWTLLKPIARGGMGEVYLATAESIEGAERPAVLKRIRREHAQDKSFLARFLDEARIQAQLQHPGVAQVLEASQDETGKPYVVLEYVEGRNLGELRERASSLGMQLSWGDAVAITVALCEALVHVHECTDAHGTPLQIVHRDLSPHNVMVGYGGDVKLIDFGTARGENRRCQTVSGVVFAKPGYVAPEVANNTPGGAPADLYALGIILWELVMGRRFLTGDPAKHLTEVAAGRANPPAISLTQNVPLELDTVIARLTAPGLEQRYPTARDALSGLISALKRAPSLADGERGVRGRVAHLMARLYPAEPARSRSEFARLVSMQREAKKNAVLPLESEEPSQKDPRVLPGTRYRIEREISHSDLGVVYEATHIDLGRKVALKVLPQEHCDNPEFERSFREEAKALARLRHPGVVQLHDFGVTQDARPFCAMELLSGVSLKQYARSRKLEWTEVVELGVQICSALEAAHALDIIHRDIKPANIFITDDYGVKLIDFGIAQTSQGPVEDETDSLTIRGTVEYMAPEQLLRASVDARADVYALASVLYELLTDQLPYQEDNTVGLIEAKQVGRVPPPSQLCPAQDIPRSLDRVILKALSPDPSGRFATATDFTIALNRTRTTKARRRRQFQAVGIAASVALLGVGLSHIATSGRAFDWLSHEPPTGAHLAAVTAAAPHGPLPDALIASAPGLLSAALRAAEADGDTAARQAASPAPTGAQPEPSGLAGPAPEGVGAPPPAAPAGEAAAELAQRDAAPATDTAEGEEQDTLDAPTDAVDAPRPGLTKAQLEEDALAVEKLWGQGKGGVFKALDRARVLGELYPHEPRALELWSKSAAKAKWWGESLRVAIRWAAQDDSERAQLHLARTQRLIGQRYSAIQTLKRFLAEAPEHKAATAMLERYRKD